MKKFGLFIATTLVALGMVGTSNVSAAKYVAKYHQSKIYKTKIKKIKSTDDGDWIISGTSKAPNKAKIIVASANNDDYEFVENSASSDGMGTWAKVKHGKFTAHVNGVTYSKDTAKSGDTAKVKILAITKYKKDQIDDLPEKLAKKLKKIKSTTLTYSASQANYLNSLDDSSSDDDTSIDSSSSEESSSETTESTTYDATKGENNARTHSYGEFVKSDSWVGQSYHISKAEVMQAEEEDGQTMLLVYTDDDPDHLFMVAYDGTTDAVEDDYVDVQGIFSKRQTYDTNIGGSNTVPALLAKKITVVGKADY